VRGMQILSAVVQRYRLFPICSLRTFAPFSWAIVPAIILSDVLCDKGFALTMDFHGACRGELARVLLPKAPKITHLPERLEARENDAVPSFD
jgi:hypothetical protein